MLRRMVSGIVLTLLLIGTLTFTLNIQPVKASGTIYIRANGSVDPPTAPIQRDGDIYTFTNNIYDEIVVERDNIVVDGDGYTLQGTGIGNGIDLSDRRNVTIKNTNIKNLFRGICLDSSYHNTISGNTVTANNREGISLLGADYNIISGNTVKNNTYYGIWIDWSSDNNIISGNKIANNDFGGIYNYHSSNNTISENKITANHGYGIYIDVYSHYNIISGNKIANNARGIDHYVSSNNIIYHNNFVDNTVQADSYESTNVWDDGYPSGGNYWSDYEERYPDAEELDNSGIWDTPYVIDENNQDNYPLMESWIERTVGVKVGDWAKYSVDTSWTGVLDPRLEMLSETELGMIEVTDVQGTVVTFTGTSHFKNGSELTAPDVKWDIAPTGSFGFIFWFIGSNLQVGNRVYPSGSMIINETITRTYCGVPRENNHLNLSTSGSIVPGPPYDLNKIDCYWDQATGILTEELLECNTEDLSSTLSIHLKMVDTNLWEASIPTTIGELKTKIDEFSSEREIDNQGIVKSLLAKLNVAQRLIGRGKIEEAQSILEDDFIPQVQELSGIHMTPEAADILIKSAEYIVSHL